MKIAIWAVLAIMLIMTSVHAEDAQEGAMSTFPSLKMGMDTYIGACNRTDTHFMTDGMWAGSGPAYPSTTYLQWDSPTGQACKVSYGAGDLSTCADTSYDQPIEAYWSNPAGKATVTLGKFWVPFAQQEWLYESKPGAMIQWAGDRSSLAVSANYNTELDCANAYMRVGHKIGNDAEFGVSYGAGDGFCVNSLHNRGYALDTTIGFGGFRLYGEANRFIGRDPGNAFNYISGKLYYEKNEIFKPFVASYSWNDLSETFGKFRSTVFGFDYQVTPTIGIQAATSATSDQPISWLQVHWTWESLLK